MTIKKRRVLIVASPWMGGSGTVAYQIANGLSKKGHDVHFLSYEIPFKKNGNSRITFHKVQPYTYPLFPFPIYELALAESIAEIIMKYDIDIVHSHYGILFGHAAELAKNLISSKRNVSTITTFHGTDSIGFDILNPGSEVPYFLNKWILEKSNAITVASNSLKNQTVQIYDLSRNIKVINNFVDINKFNKSPEVKNLSLINIVHVSNFRPVKRPDFVLQIFEGISKRFNGARLIMVGDGPELESVKVTTMRKKIRFVEFVGKVKQEDDLCKYYNQSHLMIMPSLYENFPLAALEAQACGVPVIASNVGGFPETIRNHESGELCKKDDIQEFITKSINILENKLLWDKYSHNSVLNAKNFNEEKIINEYEDLILNLKQ